MSFVRLLLQLRSGMAPEIGEAPGMTFDSMKILYAMTDRTIRQGACSSVDRASVS
jgi:hypothetical protein